jgi:foldase protein PrsA
VTKKLLAGALAVMILPLVLFAAVGCGAAANLPKNVLGKVGKVQITQDQFNAEMAIFQGVYAGRVPNKQTNPAAYKDFEIFVLDQMITHEVVKDSAATLKISVTDQEIKDRMDLVKKNSFGGDQSKFDAALKASNLTAAQLQAYYQEQMLTDKAHGEVTKNVAGASDAEITSYYDAHKSSYFQQETRTARHILIVPAKQSASTSGSASSTTTAAPTESEWAAALTKAQKVRADLVAGTDWKTEAAAFSDDSGSKNSGGDLGTVKKGQMVAEFDQALFSLAKDEISQPVKTVYGYHIIQVTGINSKPWLTSSRASRPHFSPRSRIQSGRTGWQRPRPNSRWSSPRAWSSRLSRAQPPRSSQVTPTDSKRPVAASRILIFHSWSAANLPSWVRICPEHTPAGFAAELGWRTQEEVRSQILSV